MFLYEDVSFSGFIVQGSRKTLWRSVDCSSDRTVTQANILPLGPGSGYSVWNWTQNAADQARKGKHIIILSMTKPRTTGATRV